MKKTNYLKEFAKYTSANVFAMVSIAIYILVDTFMISLVLGANGLAALNFALPIFGFVFGTGFMLGVGGATKYSIYAWQKNTQKANEFYTNTIFLTVIFSVVFLGMGFFSADFIATLFGAEGEVFEMSRDYLQIILLFAPLFIINQVFVDFIRNDGAPRLAMISMVVGSFSNILLDYLFIVRWDMGMFGAALATALAAIPTLLILLSFFVRKKNSFRLVKCKLSKKLLGSIFSTGLPIFIAEMSFGLITMVFNSIIFGLSGNVGVAAFGVIANINLVVIAIYNGIAQGIQPLLSNYYGSGNMENIKRILRYALVLTLTLSAIVYLGASMLAPQIASIFNSEQISALDNIVITGMRLYFIACVFIGFNIVMSAYFTSTDRPRPAHKLSILRGFLVVIPIGLLLASVGGMTGVWLAIPITELIVSGIVCVLFFKGRAKHGI